MSGKLWIQVGLGGVTAAAVGAALNAFVLPRLLFSPAGPETVIIKMHRNGDRLEFIVANDSDETVDLARLSMTLRTPPPQTLGAYVEVTKIYSSDAFELETAVAREGEFAFAGEVRQSIEAGGRDRFVVDALGLPEDIDGEGHFENLDGLMLPITIND